jgi:hypothetical protein
MGRRTGLLLLLFLSLPAIIPSPVSAAPLSVSGRGWGVRITLSLPTASYRRDWWVDARVRVTNISRRAVVLSGFPQTCDSSGYNGSNPIVYERTGAGRTVYPPKARHIVPCRPPIPFAMKPGQTVQQLLYVPARAPYLSASVLLLAQGKNKRRIVLHVATPRIRIRIH